MIRSAFPVSDPVSQLCPACGLCCNGVLFADVELGRGDDPERLTQLGLHLHKKGRKLAFSQPCSCFDGTLCNVYSQRPSRCRAFECRVLLRVQRGELTAKTALHTISQVRRQVESIRKLLRALGNTDEGLAMTRRYAQVMAQPLDLAEDETIETRARLMLEVDTLMKSLQRDFLT